MLKFFDQTIYVKVERDAFELFHVQDNRRLRVQSEISFSTNRMAIGEFTKAEKTLKKRLNDLYKKSFLKPAPEFVMHQTHLAEGGLCQVEERVLRELALGSGARGVYIWHGQDISEAQLLSRAYANSV